jgi:hypothetical protein
MNPLQEEFVTNSIAMKLKTLGFDKPCFAFYDANGIFTYGFNQTNGRNIKQFFFQTSINSKIRKTRSSAPLWQQAINFLKEMGVCVLQLPGDINAKWAVSMNGDFKGAYDKEEAFLHAIKLINNEPIEKISVSDVRNIVEKIKVSDIQSILEDKKVLSEAYERFDGEATEGETTKGEKQMFIQGFLQACSWFKGVLNIK